MPAVPAPIDLQPGSHLADRFELVEELGRGGMGVVWRGIDRSLDRHVAVKILACDKPGSLARFEAEARITAQLFHPNNVRVFEHGYDAKGHPFIVMELLRGRRLADLRLPLRPLRALEIARQLALALNEAHTAGLVHRDLKPSNVMIETRDGRDHARVLDYGVAKDLRRTSDLTREGSFIGTLVYASPEQLRRAKVDARTDVYALGCVLFEMLVGEAPFDAPDEAAVLYRKLHESNAPLALQLPPGTELPQGAAELIAEMMAMLPRRRPQSMAEVARRIDPMTQGWRLRYVELPELDPLADSTASATTVGATESVDGAPREAPDGESTSDGERHTWSAVASEASNARVSRGATSPRDDRRTSDGPDGDPASPPPRAPSFRIRSNTRPRVRAAAAASGLVGGALALAALVVDVSGPAHDLAPDGSAGSAGADATFPTASQVDPASGGAAGGAPASGVPVGRGPVPDSTEPSAPSTTPSVPHVSAPAPRAESGDFRAGLDAAAIAAAAPSDPEPERATPPPESERSAAEAPSRPRATPRVAAQRATATRETDSEASPGSPSGPVDAASERSGPPASGATSVPAATAQSEAEPADTAAAPNGAPTSNLVADVDPPSSGHTRDAREVLREIYSGR